MARNPLRTKRYEILDEEWNVLSRICSSQPTPEEYLDPVIAWSSMACSGCCVQVLLGGTCRSVLGLGGRFITTSEFGETGKHLIKCSSNLKLYDQGLIDRQTWMIDSNSFHATRDSSGTDKRRCAQENCMLDHS